MPYNTRRKSLSLPSLGIHVPTSHGPRTAPALTIAAATVSPRMSNSRTQLDSHRSESSTPFKLPSTQPSTSATTTITLVAPSHSGKRGCDLRLPQQVKKVKRTHCTSATFNASTITEHTPPPSPKRHDSVSSLDTNHNAQLPSQNVKSHGKINDEIVEAVVSRLEATGNRPHLVKELSLVLIQTIRIVQQSANPTAIISSRLSAFLKRPHWSPDCPCPIAKELEIAHPRRTFYYLTTCPSQSFLGEYMMPPPMSMVVTPSISDEDEVDAARRRELSPSPEVDLSSHQLQDLGHDPSQPSHPGGALSSEPLPPRPFPINSRGGRVPSPTLEKVEREFTQIAGLQKRKLAGILLEPSQVDVEEPAKDESHLFYDLKYLVPGGLHQATAHSFASSPATRPSFPKKDGDVEPLPRFDGLVEWDRNPENVGLEELDGLLDQI